MKFLLGYWAWLLKNLAYVAMTVGIASTIGFGSGWIVKDKFFKAAQVTVIKKVLVADAKGLAEAQKKNDELAAENNKLQILNTQLGDMLVNAIPATPPLQNAPKEAAHESCPDLSRNLHLNAHAVGLLNRALDGTAPDPEGWSDGEKQTLEATGLRELSAKLKEVALECRALGNRHDGLVDDVAEFQKKQLKARQK